MIARARARSGLPTTTVLGLLLLAGAAWAGLVGAMMTPLGGLMMPSDSNWRITNFAAVYAMWALMMAAMMLPSAAPMAATYAMLSRKSGAPGDRIALFVAAYLLVWAAFSIAATAVHWTLQALGFLSPMGSSTSGALAGALLLMAGAFQFTSLKRTCLLRCRTPLGFLITEWRDGAHGALLMGLRHGLFCIGCCWAMMVLLFAFGVMSLPWVGLLATAVAIEKVVPGGDRFANWLGATLLLVGTGLIGSTIL